MDGRQSVLKKFLQNEAGTSKLQIYSILERQASSADPNTILRPQGLRRAGNRRDTSPMLVQSPDAVFFTQPRWLGYALLANLHRHTRYAGVRICFVGIRKKRSANKVPGRKWCFSNDDPCTCAAKNSILNHPRSLSRPTSYPPEF